MTSVALGVALRSMGPQSTRATLLACARAAEDAGFESPGFRVRPLARDHPIPRTGSLPSHPRAASRTIA
jgi:hypothetical protein